MRHTVRSWRKAGWCRKQIKGASADDPQNGSKAVDQELIIFKGKHCFTDFEHKGVKNFENQRKSAYKSKVKARGGDREFQRAA